MAFAVARSSSDGLNQRRFRAEEPFFIRVQNRDERNLRNIQAFPQKVDADQYIKNVQPHIPDNLRTLERINIRMQIFDADTRFGEIVRQILCHLLGQCRDKHLVLCRYFPPDLRNQIVNLTVRPADVNFRIQKSRRTDHLLCAEQFMFLFIFAGCSRAKQHLIDFALELPEIQRPVIERRRKTEAVVHERLLAVPVSVIHGTDLRYRHMRLIDDNQVVVREEIHQGKRFCSRRHEIQMSRIVFDTGAEACLPHHLDVKIGSLRNPLCLEKLVLTFEIPDSLFELRFDIVTGFVDFLLRHNIVRSRIDHDMLQLRMHSPRERFHLGDPVNLVTEELDPDQILAALRGINFNRVSMNPEIAALQILVISLILNRDQLFDNLVAVLVHAGPQRYGHSLEFIRAAKAVNTGNAGDDNHVSALRKRSCRRKTQLVDLVIDRRVLGNIGVRLRHVGFGLIVIVIGNKVFDRVLGKELFHLPVKLSGQCFIVRDDQRRLVQCGDNIGHRKCLAGARNPQQRLELIPCAEAVHKFPDGPRLVTGRLIFRMKNEPVHPPLLSFSRS